MCAALVAAAVLAAAATAAPHRAAASPVGPVAWAGQVCSSLNLWQNTFEHRTAALKTPRLTRASLVAGIAQLTAEAGSLRTAFGRAGTPDLPQGAAIQQTLERAVAVFAAALSRDRALALRAPAAAMQGRLAIVTAIAGQGKSVGAAFVGLGGGFNSAEFNAALDQATHCALIHG